MCLHLWEHYQFTQDSEFLRKTALPIMLESARFILDFMVEAPAGTTFAGKLVTNPSHSPENTFFTEDHRRVWFCVSAAMDTQIIDQLFRNCLAALDAGGQTSELRQKIADALKRLPPMQISPKTGRLMEWIQDFEEPEPGHRHVSHMFAIYPGDGITPTARPDLVAAARKSIEFRFANDYHATGWSLPWLGCIFARMGDGDRALQMLTQRIAHFTMPNAMFSNAHGNPQVADACGFAAAIAEMLLQSHEGFINVLPALPRQWPSGKISGLRARGGFELDIEWSAGRATRTTVRSLAGNPCRLRVNGKLHELSLARGEQRTFE
jgi:alpha-L-fucosidase 2